MTRPWKTVTWSIATIYILYVIFLSDIYNPWEFELLHSLDYIITFSDALQTVGFLWTSDQPVAETTTSKHNT
jgi:hypothetical protein